MLAKQTGFIVLFVLFCTSVLVFHRRVMNLFKPRINMVGGTSLVYQIKVPAGGYHSSTGRSLAEDEIAALKRRIDPEGVKKYVWRPQGEDRLEIQIPGSGKNAEAAKARDAYIEANRMLDTFNIRRPDVVDAIEHLTGDGQKAGLNELAAGLSFRKDLFAQLLHARADVLAAHSAHDAEAEARASVLYDNLLDQLDTTNVKPSQLEVIAEKPADQRKAELDGVKAAAGASPDRLKAIDQFVTAFDAYRGVKAALDDVEQLKRDVQGMGVLEFRIITEPGMDVSDREYDSMRQWLNQKGPQAETGDKLGWFEVDRPADFRGRTGTFGGKEYVLCWLTPKESMVNEPGIPRWAMENVALQMGADGKEVVAFQLDKTGGILFHNFTASNTNRPLAAILDGKIFSIANIQSAIGARGEISGDFTPAELNYLVSTLNAGTLPAELQADPVSEKTIGPEQAQNR